MMKRVLVFGFLGPVLSGWLLVIAGLLLNERSVAHWLVIPYVVIEIVPLLLCGLADLLLEEIPFRERVFVLAIVGACLSGAAMFVLAPKAFQDLGLEFALSGAPPAVICALIVERLPRSEQA